MTLSALGDIAQWNYAHTEKTQNFMNFINYSPNAHNETMRTLLQRGMRLSAVGECAKILLAHSPTALSELKPRISQ